MAILALLAAAASPVPAVEPRAAEVPAAAFVRRHRNQPSSSDRRRARRASRLARKASRR